MANEQRGGSGNFANDRERASEAGKKGGEHSHGGQQQQGSGRQGQQGGNSGNFANDREKASEAGRKGDKTKKKSPASAGLFFTRSLWFGGLLTDNRLL